ncbi:uncharacterized protein BDR25DRAFT_357145 [Lindgomyces ingoldianus]|uniref:Uncharacterized protein n=1 Tax=Lindgomyces ingoldianus TaxID=673940 RepID=A0ACB6QP30_9PLEO|nr:uncharacterized protein BDR25DRAFT_357145 [Lindgomyces ingoldianus]KAF2468784.1 hypothetical protein BDR25DRAFT_357145 [Lindgomyces ingoldianus]
MIIFIMEKSKYLNIVSPHPLSRHGPIDVTYEQADCSVNRRSLNDIYTLSRATILASRDVMLAPSSLNLLKLDLAPHLFDFNSCPLGVFSSNHYRTRGIIIGQICPRLVVEQLLVHAGVGSNAKDTECFDKPWLSITAIEGYEAVVEQLLAHRDVDPGAEDTFRETSLFIDPISEDKISENIPLLLAETLEYKEIVAQLLAKASTESGGHSRVATELLAMNSVELSTSDNMCLVSLFFDTSLFDLAFLLQLALWSEPASFVN